MLICRDCHGRSVGGLPWERERISERVRRVDESEWSGGPLNSEHQNGGQQYRGRRLSNR
jgi:hypothetical protein